MEHTKGEMIVDIRVGCIAVYPAPRKKCLSGIERCKTTLLYHRGEQKNDSKGKFISWVVDPQIEANAHRLAKCWNKHDELKKQNDLLTLGLLEAGRKKKALLETLKMIDNSIFQDSDGEWQLSRPARFLKTIAAEARANAGKE